MKTNNLVVILLASTGCAFLSGCGSKQAKDQAKAEQRDQRSAQEANQALKDYSKRLDAPAAWYGDESATPKGCFFTFNHRQDIKGCTPEQLLKNMAALKLDAFGPPSDAATEAFPYHHTRILTTSYPVVTVDGENSPGAKAAHTSVIAGANAARWKRVWTYMLTARVP